MPTIITIDTTAPAVSAADLLTSSDTGMDNADDVTKKMSPAFSGTAEANAKIRVLANGLVVGNGVATSQGFWEVTVEPLADGNYDITVVAEDKAGNVSDTATTPALTIEIDTLEPNTPLLDLITADDTGHSNKDNITNADPPTFTMTTQDPNQAEHISQFNYKFRVYDRPEGATETLIFNSVTDLPPAELMAGFTDQEFLTTSLDLSEGIHNLKLEVEDRAGNISHDFLLNVEIDTTVPIAGDPDLIDSSDSGMSNTDNVTNKMQPAFYGRSEANTTVRVFAQPVDRDGNVLGANVLVGQGTVGSDQSDITAGGAADDGLGVWEVTVEPLDDGIYDITVQIEDWAGNSDTSANPLTIEIDTLEPNTPLLDLITADDTGHSNTDNITNADPPTFTMTTPGSEPGGPHQPVQLQVPRLRSSGRRHRDVDLQLGNRPAAR